jgi:hypothetical protein
MHVGAYGSLVTLTAKDKDTGEVLDISGYTTLTVKITGPTDQAFSRDADFVTDGTDGELGFYLQENDLDEEGEWKAQPILEKAGESVPGEVLEFYVEESL